MQLNTKRSHSRYIQRKGTAFSTGNAVLSGKPSDFFDDFFQKQKIGSTAQFPAPFIKITHHAAKLLKKRLQAFIGCPMPSMVCRKLR